MNLNTYHARRAGAGMLRRGNMLVGCLVILGVLVVIAVITTIFVIKSYRGWLASLTEETMTAMLTEARIDPDERTEVMAHISTLMDRYKAKELSLEELGHVLEEVGESPVVGAAVLIGADRLYLDNAEIPDEEKTQMRVQLRRYAQGLRERTIAPKTLDAVLDPISTTDPDGDDIQMQWHMGPSGSSGKALRSPDEVTSDDLRAVIAQAKLHADEAGVPEDAPETDLSDELAIAIARALGEDPAQWLPAGSPALERLRDQHGSDHDDADRAQDDPAGDDDTDSISDNDNPDGP